MIKKIPLPVTGVALGLAALGNLLQSYSENLRLICGILSFLILLLFVIKILIYREELGKDMQNPVMASVAATVPMTVMLLSTYINKFAAGTAKGVWYAGIILHIVMIVFFTRRFVLKLKPENVYPSYFIVYVGIVVASVTSPQFGETGLGRMIWYAGMILWTAALAMVIYRYVKVKEIKDPVRPLFCIFAAPAGLCLAGYLQAFPEKNMMILYLLMAVALVFYVITIVKVPGYIMKGFYPSFAAFTFPFVIQAIGLKQANAFLISTGKVSTLLVSIVNVETVIACVLVIYTAYCFGRHIFKKSQN